MAEKLQATRTQLEGDVFFGFDSAMPIKRKTSAPQLELEVRHENGKTYPTSRSNGVQLHYENKLGRLYLGDSLHWLQSLTDASDYKNKKNGLG